LDDLSHKWKKRYRPKENLPPGDQDPVIWRVAGTCDCVDQTRPRYPRPGRVFQTPAAGQTDPCRSRRVAARAPGPKAAASFPAGARLLACWLHRARKIFRSFNLRKQETNLWKAYCAPAMKFRLLGGWFLCSCLWNCYFPVALEWTEACFSSWFVDRLTHCVRISFRIGIWKPPMWSSSLEARNSQGERSGTSLVAKQKLVKEKRFAYRNYLLLVTQSFVCAISLSLSLSLSVLFLRELLEKPG
jgi:hypothetical protein